VRVKPLLLKYKKREEKKKRYRYIHRGLTIKYADDNESSGRRSPSTRRHPSEEVACKKYVNSAQLA
jgi:hypothetical protein